MPRKSLKRAVLEELESVFIGRKVDKVLRVIIEDKEDDVADFLDMAVNGAYDALCSRRYLFRPSARKGLGSQIFQRDLCEEISEDKLPWLTEDEFLQKYRVHKETFWHLHEKIKDHPVFQPPSGEEGTKKQAPASHQLMVLMHYLGTSGSAGNNPRLRNVFGIGRGTAQLYRDRCVLAIRSVRKEVIKWPDEEERKKISQRIFRKYNWPHCVGVADGTLFPLTYEPQAQDAPDYSGRKFQYSLSVMIINDDERRIRHYLSGFPGSAHDNRVYAATCLAREPNNHFTDKQYIVGDSAFENSPSVVASFKAPRGHDLPEMHRLFNYHLGKLRVSSEHTIGLLKGRFPWLRSIPMKITDDRRSLRKILTYIDCCVVLHNILIDLKDEAPEEWVEQEDDDDTTMDGLIDHTVVGQDKDERRQRLLEYFRDYVF